MNQGNRIQLTAVRRPEEYLLLTHTHTHWRGTVGFWGGGWTFNLYSSRTPAPSGSAWCSPPWPRTSSHLPTATFLMRAGCWVIPGARSQVPGSTNSESNPKLWFYWAWAAKFFGPRSRTTDLKYFNQLQPHWHEAHINGTLVLRVTMATLNILRRAGTRHFRPLLWWIWTYHLIIFFL